MRFDSDLLYRLKLNDDKCCFIEIKFYDDILNSCDYKSDFIDHSVKTKENEYISFYIVN